MNLSLLSFGRELRERRKKLNLTQKDVSLRTGINTETLRRIENGTVIPKFETLEYLSVIYKDDLNRLLLKYRVNDFNYLQETKDKLESKFDKDDFKTLNIELKELKLLIANIDNSYYRNYFSQFALLVDGIIIYKDKGNFKESINILTEAVKITSPNFDLENYNILVYTSMEIRILMNIAFVLNKLNYTEDYIELLEFIINTIDEDNEILPKLCHNLSGAYTRSKYYNKALYFSDLGIKVAHKTRNSNGLNILYYGKGLAEYFLDKSEYKETILTAIYLCKANGDEVLKDRILYNCKEIFNMELINN